MRPVRVGSTGPDSAPTYIRLLGDPVRRGLGLGLGGLGLALGGLWGSGSLGLGLWVWGQDAAQTP